MKIMKLCLILSVLCFTLGVFCSYNNRLLYARYSIPKCENGKLLIVDPIKIDSTDAVILKESLRKAKRWRPFKIIKKLGYELLLIGENDTIVIKWDPGNSDRNIYPVAPENIRIGNKYYIPRSSLKHVLDAYFEKLSNSKMHISNIDCRKYLEFTEMWSDTPEGIISHLNRLYSGRLNKIECEDIPIDTVLDNKFDVIKSHRFLLHNKGYGAKWDCFKMVYVLSKPIDDEPICECDSISTRH